MAAFTGLLQADGYAGFEALYGAGRTAPGPVTEVACWAHCRRGFFDEWEHRKSAVAKEALDRIAAIYVIEAKAAFAPAAERVAIRTETAPSLETFFAWAEATLAKLSAKSALAAAFRYTINRREALSRFVTDGRLEVDNNIAENAMRIIAMAGSLCIPSLSVWKHWKCVRVVNATRATFSGDCSLDRRRGNVVGADLVRRTSHDLHSRQNACGNQTPYRVVGDTQGFRRLAHGEPFATFLR
jgi:hypothetical protein